MVAMSIINEFHSAEQRAFIRTVLKRSWHISLSSLLYWRLNISGKNKTSQEYIGAGLQHKICKQNIRKHLLRARIVFYKKCFNVRDYGIFSACFFRDRAKE